MCLLMYLYTYSGGRRPRPLRGGAAGRAALDKYMKRQIYK